MTTSSVPGTPRYLPVLYECNREIVTRHYNKIAICCIISGEEWRRLRSAVNATTMKPKVVRSYAKAQKVVSDDFLAVMKENICPQTGEIPEFEILLNKWALESVAVVLLDTR